MGKTGILSAREGIQERGGKNVQSKGLEVRLELTGVGEEVEVVLEVFDLRTVGA